ncbi:MAG: choice-of-anchor Q domain-containing protein, partial [Verrucomicrobiales bacterium]|nr:choice-of-anchor Q domain-containing protein [Verrucomicrobiales bacterium]
MKKRSLLDKILPQNKSEKEDTQREYIAEQLESRILYSGAPAPAEVPVQEVVQDSSGESPGFEGVESFTGPDHPVIADQSASETLNEIVTLTSLDNLSADEIDYLANAAVERWKAADLSAEQLEALEAIEISILDIEGLAIAETNGYDIELDLNANGSGWFIDSTPFLDEEFDYAESSTVFRDTDGDAQHGIDLLTVMMHEMGHVLGMEDIYESAQEHNLLYGGFEEGVRKLPVAGQADGAAAGSQSDAHASITVTNLLDDDGASGTPSLRDAINQAVSGETITLVDGQYVISKVSTSENGNLDGDFDINNKNITIVGAGKWDSTLMTGTLIDAQQIDRVFHILGTSNVTLQDMTITGGLVTEGNGGGILHEGGTLMLENVAIDSNEVQDTVDNNTNALGGGLYNNNRTLIATNTDFTNNKATRNGGNETAGGGGLFSSGGSADVTITGGTISGNTARDGGGLYIWSQGATATLDGVTITANRGDNTGGGFRFHDGATIDFVNGATITDNTAHNSGGGGYISAAATVNMNDGSAITITGNKVADAAGTTIRGSGGGFYVHEGSQLSIDNATIQGNTADEGGGFYIIRRDSTIDISNSTISENFAEVRGGGFRSAQEGTIVNMTNTVISENTAETEHGGGFYNVGDVKLTGVTISANHAGIGTGDRGGGFYNTLGNVTIIGDSKIIDNSATEHGGGFWNRNGTVTITGTDTEKIEIQGNKVGVSNAGTILGNAGNGAGFWSSDASTSKLTHVDLIGNISSENGSGVLNGVGAGAYITSASQVELTDVTIDGHTANEGGAFYISDPHSKLTGTRVSLDDNTARTRGGAFRVAQTFATVELTNSTINNNIAQNEHGGGFYNNGTVSLTNTSVDNNQALDLVTTGINLDGTDGILYRRASYGGGFYNGGGSVSLLGSSTVKDNDTYGHGAGFYTSGGTVTAAGTVISGNEILRDLAVAASTADGDTIRHGAGFASFGDGNVNLTDVTISGNKTGIDTGDILRGSGGGFYNQDGSTVNISGDSQIIGNHAQEGGAFYNTSTGSTVEITGTTGNAIEIGTQTDPNVARVRGGGFRSTGNTNVNLSYVDISFNTAEGERGGGIYADGAHIVGDNVSITNNAAIDTGGSREGGGLFLSGNGLTELTDSTISDNSTNHHGGGFYLESGQIDLAATTISGNFTNNSGAGYFVTGNGIVNLTDSSVTNNIAHDHGGGFYSASDSKITATRSNIDGNLAGHSNATTRDESGTSGIGGVALGDDLRGGGFWASERANITLIDSALTNNEAARYGGGGNLENEATLTLLGSTVSGNVGDQHGGGFRIASNAHLYATNSTISGNYAGFVRAENSGVVKANYDGRYGGGIWVQSSGNQVILNHTTVTNNFGTSGGAAGGAGIYRSAGFIQAENSIIYGNIADADLDAASQDASDMRGAITLIGANVLGTHNNGTVTLAEDAFRITADPGLAALADNGGVATPGGNVQTHAITGSSVAADAAVNSRVSTDQLGNGRLPGASAATTSVLSDINGADLLTDTTNVTMGTARTTTVDGTSLDFNAGSATNETLFDVAVAQAGTLAAGDLITVTVTLDYTRPSGDHDPAFILTDGSTNLTISTSDNAPGTVSGNGTLFTGTHPANGAASQIVLTYTFSDAGNRLGAAEGGKSGSNSGTASLNAANGLTWRMRGGNAGELFQVDKVSVSYDVISGTSDIGAFEVDPVTDTLTLDTITIPQNAIVTDGASSATVELSAAATSTGAGPLNYDWTATAPDGSDLAVTGNGTSAASFAYGPSADNPVGFVDVSLTVTDATTGQLVTSEVHQVRFVDPNVTPATFTAGTIEVDTLGDENDGVRLDYNTETADFNVGQILTGATTGTQATIISVTDNGADGTLVLEMIPNTGTGNFASGEAITDDGTTPGAALAASTLYDITLREAINMANASGAGNFEITFNAGVTDASSIQSSLTYRELNYDSQNGTDFIVGEIITGASDGTQATIIDIIGDSGGSDTTGRLVLEIIGGTGDGDFNNNESISAPSGSTALANGSLFQSYNSGYDYDITKSNGMLVINGNGPAYTIIDGNGVDRVFDIRPDASVIFKDLTIQGGATTLTDGNSEHGGGVKNEGGIGIFQGVTISNNSAAAGSNAGQGGAIYTTSSGRSNGLILMTDSLIENNSSESNGGGIYMAGTNVGESLLYLKDTVIRGNTAASAGGNLDDRRGGGFYITDDGNKIVFDNVTVSDNLTNGRHRNDGGGGAFTGADHTIEVTGGSFIRNKAGQDTNGSDSDGGGFWSGATRSQFTFDGTEIGGALDGSGNVDLGNTSEDDGGGFYLEGRFNTYDFVDVKIEGNRSYDGGGGFFVANDSETLHFVQTATGNSYIKDNYSETEHGGGFRNDGVVHINTTDSKGNASVGVFTISGNQARTNGTLLLPDGTGSTNADRIGGGFYATSNSETNLQDVVLENNIANRRGGAFYAAGGSVVNITSTSASTSGDDSSFVSKIQNNHTVDLNDGDGGGFYVSGANTRVNLTDVLVDSNTASDDGGGFLSQSNNSHTSLTRVDLTNNVALDNGGGFYNESQSSRVSLDTVQIDTNRSTTLHGGGFRNNGIVEGKLVTITNNSANNTTDGLENTILTNNQDRIGGGFYNYQGTVTLEDAIIEDNRAYSRGAGIFNQSGGIVIITSNTIRSSISNNLIDQNSDQNNQQWRNFGSGAAIFQESAGSMFDLTGVDIVGNMAKDDGGGIFMTSDGSSGSLTDVLIQSNQAGDEGGGIYIASGGITLTLSHVAIIGNMSETIVGALRPDDQSLTLGDSGHGGGISNRGVIIGDNVTISGNKSGVSDVAAGNDSNNVGGGIYSTGTSARVQLTNAAITDNEAYGRGGGVYNAEGILELTDFVVSGNSADQGTSESQGRAGGIWNSGNGDVTLTGGLVSDNKSFGHSGGIHNQDTGSTLTISNVTLTGNTAGYDVNAGAFVDNRVAGALWALSGGAANVTLTHSTVTNNHTTRNGTDSGAGIRIDNGGKKVIVSDSIIYGNRRDVDNAGGVVEDIDNNIGAELIFEGTNIVGTTAGTISGGTILRDDPTLDTLADNGGPAVGATLTTTSGAASANTDSQTAIIQTHSFQAGSAATNAAASTASATVTTDARGFDRPAGDTSDLGAYERSVPTLNVTATPTSIAEGATVTLSGDILYDLFGSDTVSEVVLTVDWGDGTEGYVEHFPETTDFAATTPDINLDHIYGYGTDGQFTLTVSLQDAVNGPVVSTATFTVNVTDTEITVMLNGEDLTASTTEDDTVTIDPFDTTGGTATQIGDLSIPFGDLNATGNRMGWSVDVSGDVAVIGGEGRDGEEEVWVYRLNSGTSEWELEQRLKNDDITQFDDFGYAVAVVDDGVNERIFVGAQLDDTGGSDKGAVYYYRFNGTDWVMEQKIQGATGHDSGDYFGASLAVTSDGQYLAVGAPREDSDSLTDSDVGGSNDSGAVFLFSFDGADYVQEDKVKAQLTAGVIDNQGGDQFGQSVAIDGTTLVVGSELEDIGGSNSGAAWVYIRNAGTWDLEQKIDGGTGIDADDRFGYRVAISGDTIAIGARLADTGGSNTGQVNIFTRTGGVWTEAQVIGDADDGTISDSDTFGTSVSLDGNRLIIGSPAEDNPTNSGAAYIFDRADASSAFTLTGILNADDETARDSFGWSVAADGENFVIGARQANLTYDIDAINQIEIPDYGAAYIFSGTGSPTQVGTRLDGDFANITRLTLETDYGRRVAIEGDFAIVGQPKGAKDPANADERTGQAHVFRKNNNGTPGNATDDTWDLIATLAPPTNADDNDDYFGWGVNISADGSVAVVTAIYDDNPSNSGALYVFEQNADGDYDYQGRIKLTDATSNDNLGRKVDISSDGKVIITGVPGDDDGGSGSGSAVIYDVRDTGTYPNGWSSFFTSVNIASDGVKLLPSLDVTSTASDQFGYAVAIDATGNRIVVGAWDDDYPTDDNSNNNSRDRGSAYVYDWDGSNWVMSQKIFASNNGKDDRFGRDVDIDGDVIVVGAYTEDSSSPAGNNNSVGDSGAAYVFERNNTTGLFEEVQILKAIDRSGSDQFGINVAIDGNDIVVGAFVEDTGGNQAGSAYVFRKDASAAAGQQWVTTDVLRNPNQNGVTVDQFGLAVDVSDGIVIVGAPNDSFTLPNGVEAVNFGSVYSYALDPDSDPTSAANNPGIVDQGALFVPDEADLATANRIGYAVHIDGNLAIVGSEGLGHQEEVYIYRDTTGNGDWVLESTLFNPAALTSGVDQDQIDDFGQSVSIIDSGTVDGIGDRAFVGARLEDNGGTDKGRVYFYEFDGTDWVLKQQIIQGNSGDDFGWAMAADGDFLAVAARLEDADTDDAADTGGANDSGAVLTFVYNSGTGEYDLVQKIKQTDETGTLDVFTSDQFGSSVAIDNGTLVIGQELEDYDVIGGTNDTASNSGAAYVWVWNATTSTFDFEAKLKSSDSQADDRFGVKVDISGDTIVVGASQEDTGGSNTGSAYVFTRTTGVWTESQKLGDADAARISDDDRFGHSVAIDGNRILISGRLDDTSGSNSGRVWVFERADSDLATPFVIADINGIAASGTEARDEFGYHIAMDGDRYLIGARRANVTLTIDDATKETINISDWGAAYVFEAGSGGAVTEQHKFDGDIQNKTEIGSTSEYGRRVVISGDYAVVGAPRGGKGPNTGDERTGRAYVYHREDMGTNDTSDDQWTLVSEVAPPTTDDDFDDYFGQGIDISEDGKVLAVGAYNHEGAGGGTDRGAVYIYELNATGDGYDLQGRIRPSTIAGNNTNDLEFGRSVTLNEDGSVLAVGRWLDDNEGVATNVGAIFLYDVTSQAGATSSAKWDTFLQANGTVQNGIDYSVNDDGIHIVGDTADDRFGRSLALSGTTLVVGAYNNDTGGSNRGMAYVFDQDSGGAGSWGLTQAFQASDAGNSDQFGIDVDIDGDKIIVGAQGQDASYSGSTDNSLGDSGAAYIFTRSGAAGTATWTETQILKASVPGGGDQFGFSVGIDGDIAVVGAYLNDSASTNAGAAYVYQNDAGTWSEISTLLSPNGDTNDNFGRAVDVGNGSVIVGAPRADRTLAGGIVNKEFGAAYTYQVVPVSTAGNTLTIASVDDPNTHLTTGSITTDGSTISFDPGEDYDYLQEGESATASFTYTVSDGVGGSATESVVITIHGINDSPVATDETITTDEDNPGSGTLAGFTDQDTNNTDLKISAVNGDSGNVGTAVALAGGGTVTINANGTYSINPAGAYDYLADGETATNTVNYTVTDSEGRIVYQPIDGALVGEAIDTSSRVGNGWSTIDEANAGQNVNSLTGSRTGTFLQVPDTTGGILNPGGSGLLGSPALEYQVEIQEAGTYTLHLRGAAFDLSSDSLYASIVNNGDGLAGGTADWYQVGIPASSDFTWVSTGRPEVTDGSGSATSLDFNLGVGIHTIYLSAREDGVALDSWMLRKSDSTVTAPSGTDAGPAGQLTATVTVEITGVNDNPVITSDGGGATATVNAAENQTAVTTVTATDVDLPAQNLTFTITGGADAALFDITAGGVLTFKVAPDFENATDDGTDGVYDVQVTVTDDGAP